MPRGVRNSEGPSSKVGDIVFYNYAGQRRPAVLVAYEGGSTNIGTATLNVFTDMGVQLVRLAQFGEGDMQWSATPPKDGKPAPVVVEEEPDEEEPDESEAEAAFTAKP